MFDIIKQKTKFLLLILTSRNSKVLNIKYRALICVEKNMGI